jgi:hypothetical protein
MLLLAVASMMTGSTKGGPVGPSPVYAPKKAEYATEAPKYYTTKAPEYYTTASNYTTKAPEYYTTAASYYTTKAPE